MAIRGLWSRYRAAEGKGQEAFYIVARIDERDSQRPLALALWEVLERREPRSGFRRGSLATADRQPGGFGMSAVKFRRLDPVIETFKAKLGDALTAVVLFGSHARREGGRSSDWDLFLIAEALPDNPFDRQLFLRSLLPLTAGRISIVAKTRREFETDFPPLYLDLAIDGILLYDSGDYMKGKLEQIRRIIGQAGLKRVRRKGALVWEWARPPQGRWRIDWSGVYGL